jgi:hypothetical protein
MLTMDVFRQDAFSATSLTASIDKIGYVPGLLGSIPGLFVPVPVRTEMIIIEERENAPALIQTTARGAPAKEKGGDRAKARAFRTVRLAEKSRITASELQGNRIAKLEWQHACLLEPSSCLPRGYTWSRPLAAQ